MSKEIVNIKLEEINNVNKSYDIEAEMRLSHWLNIKFDRIFSFFQKSFSWWKGRYRRIAARWGRKGRFI